MSRISEALTRKAPENGAVKSKISRSRKEDKELEELSAFFSRRTSHNMTEDEHRDLEDRRNQYCRPVASKDLPRCCCTSHGSQISRSIRARSESERGSGRSSSVPTIVTLSAGHTARHRPSSKPQPYSMSSRQHDSHLAEDESRSCHSGRAHAGRGTSAATVDGRGHGGKSEIVKPPEFKTSHPREDRFVNRTVLKDAGAQTDLALGTEDTLLRKQLHAPERNRSLRDLGSEAREMRQDRGIRQRPNEDTDEPAQLSVGKGLLDGWSALAAMQVEHTTHNHPGTEHYRCGGDAGSYPAGGGSLLGAQSQKERDIRGTYSFSPFPQSGQAGGFAHATEGDIRAPMDPPPSPMEEHPSWPSQSFGAHESFHEAENLQTAQEEGGPENLEDFIARIEGEALLFSGQEKLWGVPDREVDLVDHLIAQPFGLPELVSHDGAGEVAMTARRNWFPLEPDLVPHVALDDTAVFRAGDRLTCPDLLAAGVPYSERREEEESVAGLWRPKHIL